MPFKSTETIENDEFPGVGNYSAIQRISIGMNNSSIWKNVSGFSQKYSGFMQVLKDFLFTTFQRIIVS